MSSTEIANKKLNARITGKKDIFNDFLDYTYHDSDSESHDPESSSSSLSDADESDAENLVVLNRLSRSRTKKQAAIVNPASAKNNAMEAVGFGYQKENRKKLKKGKGDHLNAYANEFVVKRHLPMWSNIFNRKFERTIIRPTSSASVECEIRKVKHNALNGQCKTLRIDRSVELIIKYYDGKLRILPAENNAASSDSGPENDSTVDREAEILDLGNSPIEETTDEGHHSYDEAAYISTENANIDKNSGSNHIPSQNVELENEIVDVGQNINDKENQAMPTVNKAAQNIRSQSVHDESDRIQCEACLNGHQPPGGHSCRICLRKVHAIHNCSVPLSSDSDNEGYGKPRTCLPCLRKSAANNTDQNNQVSCNNKIVKGNRALPLRDISYETQCKAYRNGPSSQATRQCHICLRNVHIIPDCSLPFSSNSDYGGDGQLRICISCSKNPDVDRHIAMNEIENHKGHAMRDLQEHHKQRGQKNLYVSVKALIYANENNSFKSLSLLKRGSDPNLSLVVL
ncbi:uncharacterized protein LOC130903369 [Diorhabda carinulata]|uniref:uncharacterized protein LOC130892792 n=1 Tax=Diorhabda carinulata TaxID=1163345 RepID=UPI0025A2AD53|nr:uncharacterized protein LOC130892792 [Diorhabda carinulata]XP_057654395.1 uncharacterized protein LOC130892792 [Diorhabda carinulata]XP_057654396.1 uncharacterized protein LOC130892792 [Diorhabda carinulata]XP_057654397.1 uncharacterized protein LOC130892792 [Diorhabda carinulata]XP_057654398.1 uncharacterized protein LOC130892792 [Diorhabda carinulata]XP_057671408.1 uncharacterized protein LOC130903369 [Diorhabda carinulata]